MAQGESGLQVMGNNAQGSGVPVSRKAAAGTRVEVELVNESGAAEALALDIVPDRNADFSAGFLGVGTPLAQVLLKHRAGETLPYRVADIVEVRILSVATSRRAPTGDTAARREATQREAVSKSNFDDAVRLALTVDVKWGDYDPEGIEPGWE
jgi:hypothetical protein